ncbi:MAG: protein kinase, partial [Chthoniobacterales bacterium]
MATTQDKRACSVCGTVLPDDSPYCPVCALRVAVETQSDSLTHISSELRFDHYQVLNKQDGKPLELGRGGMGVTYKAIDTHLGCAVALKIISPPFIGHESARSRFLREARAAASVRHPNVATVFHLGESGGNYFYAMEFVDGETLETLIRRRGRLKVELTLEIMKQVTAGLTAIHKQHLVHRDIKPSNIMLSWEESRLENVKIIDLGLAKGVTEDALSMLGSFVGTPAYASPEQFAGLGTDIRSDLYSLGVTLWEMLSGNPPFYGSAAELMNQHQDSALPVEKLKGIPEPITALLQVLLAKDPGQRFQTPDQLQKALTKIEEAIASGGRLMPDELRSMSAEATTSVSKNKPRRKLVRRVLVAGLCFAFALIAWVFLSSDRGSLFNQRSAESVPTEKSIAVLPFENISPNKDDAYFADGVQDEILNNLAKIAELKVISRTSVMQYRGDNRRDLRQIASALGVAHVLEGTVRRDGNHVRVSTELVDARYDTTIWADSFDGDLTDIFAIQSEVAQTIANKLSARLSPTERKTIEAKPTDNLDAYDLYLRGKNLLLGADIASWVGIPHESLIEAADFFEKSVRLDPKFTLAYCGSEGAQDLIYFWYDPTSERLAKADQAVKTALRLQPDLPEVRLANAQHLYYGYRDYNSAREQLELARHGLPNDVEVIYHEALIDRRQGRFEEAIKKLNTAIGRDPHNPAYHFQLAVSLYATRQMPAAERAFDGLLELQPDQPMLRAQKAIYVGFMKDGDDSAIWSAIGPIPSSAGGVTAALPLRLTFALVDRDFDQAAQLIEKMKGSENNGFAYANRPVPVECYLVLMSRLRGEPLEAAGAREALNLRVLKSPQDAGFLSQLAVVDALLGNSDTAISEAKRACEMLPVSLDAVDGPGMLINLAVVYAWTNKLDLAFTTLGPPSRMPFGIHYGQLKRDPYWEPLYK